jgi:O-methyltransferase involved in polyketide biosynthesis
VLFDQQVRGFLRDHPQGTVVALGEGLETQLWRVDNGSVRWVSVDLPEMIDLRRRLLPAHPRNQLVACSALDPAWTDMAGPGTPVLIVAQGLLMYFTEADVDGFFEMVASRCPGSAVLFDTIRPGPPPAPVTARTARTGCRPSHGEPAGAASFGSAAGIAASPACRFSRLRAAVVSAGACATRPPPASPDCAGCCRRR